ncbi:hypothetical protein, partial [Roseibium sp. RKSG952]|uniref:hypothetical protein n=1 Tax=Roseibium sp. RKSG952 TaxID=2529384 RepID=UPI0018AD1B7E
GTTLNAHGNRLTALDASVAGLDGVTAGQATVISEIQVDVAKNGDDITALSGKVETVETTVGENKASITTLEQST